MTKLLGLDYTIQYREGKKNLVVDALSRRFEEGTFATITSVVPNWYQEVTASYEFADWELLEQLTFDSSSRLGYTMANGLI